MYSLVGLGRLHFFIKVYKDLFYIKELRQADDLNMELFLSNISFVPEKYFPTLCQVELRSNKPYETNYLSCNSI